MSVCVSVQAAPVLEARGSATSFVPSPVGAGKTTVHHGAPKQHPAAAGCAAAHYEGHVTPLSRKTSSYGGSEGFYLFFVSMVDCG